MMLHSIQALQFQIVSEWFDTLARYLFRVNHWCALVQGEAASVLDRRYLALSGSDGIPRSLDTLGLVERRLCWPGSDC